MKAMFALLILMSCVLGLNFLRIILPLALFDYLTVGAIIITLLFEISVIIWSVVQIFTR